MTKTQLKAATVLAAATESLYAGDVGVSVATLKAMWKRGWVETDDPRRCYGAYTITNAGRKALEHATNAPEKKVEVGTCQCCLRAIVVEKGVIRRHGWRESGGRRKGEYGNAWHSGSCEGTGHVPYEVSCEKTRSFIFERIIPAAEAAIEQVKRLKGTPVLNLSLTNCPRTRRRYGEGYSSRETASLSLLPPLAELPDADEDREMWLAAHTQQEVYRHELSNARFYAKSAMSSIARDLDALAAAWRGWKPGLKTRMEVR